MTESLPKALLPVCGKPFADHQLALLARRGVRRVVYSVAYKGDQIRAHVGDGTRFGLAVTYVDEGADRRGTAGALRLALDRGVLPETFFVLYGDSYLPIALAPVADAFRTSGAPALMTVFRNDGRWDTSNVLYADGRVLLYDKSRRDPRAAEMRFIDYGLSLLSRDVVADRVAPDTVADLGTLFHALSVEGRLAGHEVSERFYEVGSPEGLRDLEAFLTAT
jgi:prepilin-type processing-associated H-X9-DG protein